MAKYDQAITDLTQVLGYLDRVVDYEKEKEAPNILNTGLGYYRQYFKLIKKLKRVPSFAEDFRITNYITFQQLVAKTQANDIIKFFHSLEEEEPEEEPVKEEPVKEDASVPPELEGLVDEYRRNQDLLNSEDIKSNNQRSVAEQVKIAIEHSKYREQILANRREREQAGEKFRDVDKTIVEYGDPKAQNINTILSSSKKAVGSVALTYPSFSDLSTSVQKQIINQAVDLNLVGIEDLDVAVQMAALQFGVKDLSSAYVSEIAEKINEEEQKSLEIENKLSQNESAIDSLQAKASLTDAERQYLNKLLNENAGLSADLNKSATRFNDFVDLQAEKYDKYLSEITKRQEGRESVDFSDLKVLANKKVASLHENFLRRGIVPRHFSELDKMNGLINAIQKDIPGVNRYATYEGSQAAAIIGGGEGQVILAYSRGITGNVLRQAEKIAAANPNSATAKFLRDNSKLLAAAKRSIRQLENSKLGKEILQPLSKANFFIRAVTNPGAALKSWAGKKAGEQFRKRIVEKIGNEVLKNASNVLLKEGVKGGIKKLAAEAAAKMAIKAATWAATKLGISIAAESLNAILPGLGVLVDIAIQATLWVAEKTIGQIKKGLDNVWQELGWGEKFRTRDILAPIAIAGATFITGLIVIRKSVQIAIVSAAGIIIGSAIAVGLYVIATYLIAPVLSTLVQFDSLEKVDYKEYGGGGAYGPGGGPGPGGGGGVVNLDCGPDAGAEIMVQAGSYPVVKKLLTGPGRTGYCIIPSKIVIHWSGAWTNNDNTYNVLVERGLSCQIGTDQDGSVQQWQQLWEKKAELAYCVGGNENNYSLNNEMVGAYFIPPGTSSSNPDEKSPSEDEIQSSVNSTCFFMHQYKIPYTQIFGHYELRPGKIDPGEEFLAYFINRVKQQCP